MYRISKLTLVEGQVTPSEAATVEEGIDTLEHAFAQARELWQERIRELWIKVAGSNIVERIDGSYAFSINVATDGSRYTELWVVASYD